MMSSRRHRFTERRLRTTVLVWAAPTVALVAGVAAEFLDFRELRAPLLALVGAGVLATAYSFAGTRTGVRPFAVALATGVLTWAGAEAAYSVLHFAAGGQFELSAGGPQPVQALALIALHGVLLGVPTGVAAGLLLQAAGRLGGAARVRRSELA
jgi:hypothetical protein